jgi:hypothetical protein
MSERIICPGCGDLVDVATVDLSDIIPTAKPQTVIKTHSRAPRLLEPYSIECPWSSAKIVYAVLSQPPAESSSATPRSSPP